MSIKSFDNLLQLFKEEMKADANANLMYLKARVNKVPGVTQR
jgi:hypothetical protein